MASDGVIDGEHVKRDEIDRLLEEAWATRRTAPADVDAKLDDIERRAAGLDLSHDARGQIVRMMRIGPSLMFGGSAAAIEPLGEILQELRRSGDDKWVARCIGQLADAHRNSGDTVRARELLQEALAIRERLGDPRETSSSLMLLADVGHTLGDDASALDLINRALELDAGLGDPRHTATLVYTHAKILRQLGRIEEAAEQAQRLLETYERFGDRPGQASALTLLGNLNRQRSDLALSRHYHERAMAIATEIGDEKSAGISWHNLGIIFGIRGEFERALECYQKALAILERLEPTAVGNTLIGFASVYSGYKNYDESNRWLERAMESYASTGNRSGIGFALYHRGGNAAKCGDLDTARQCYEKCLAIREEIGFVAGVAAVLDTLGMLEARLNNFDAAQKRFDEALETYARLGDGISTLSVRINMAVMQRHMGHPEIALPLLTDLLAEAERLEQRPKQLDLHREIASAAEDLGQFAVALEHLKAAITIEREVFTESGQRRLHMLEAERKIDLSRQEAEIERLRNVELANAHAELQRAHDDLKSAQAQLVHAGKMASLGQLTAGIAHEINNPVNFVRSSVAPLERDIESILNGDVGESERDELVEEIRSLLRSIRVGADRTAEIVRGLRTFSRLDEDVAKEVDLIEGIESTLTLLASQLAHRIRIERMFEAIPPVECHPGRINQVFMNLLSNAIDAIEGDGVITIAARLDGPGVVVEISDTGRGMTPEQLERIFEPFYTTKDVGAGQGLGLSISHGIVEQHGGHIDVESAPGAGTTFRVTIPRAAAGAP